LGSDNLLVIQGAVKTYQKSYVDKDLNGLNDFEGFIEPEGYWIKVAHNASLVF